MPHPRRYFLPRQPQHLIQRGHNRQPVFFAETDYLFYLRCLSEAAARHGCDIHAYVLMTNHVHLLLSPRRTDSIPRAMQSLGRRYVGYVNRRQGRSGTLWEGRYRATVIDSEAHLLACYRYIELNPVRAGLASRPGDYRWSSYSHHSGGEVDSLVTEHALYRALGENGVERRKAYHRLFREALGQQFIDDLRKATNRAWALGDARFLKRIAKASGRRVAPRPLGRPRKSSAARA